MKTLYLLLPLGTMLKAAKKSISGCVELSVLVNSQGRAQGDSVISSYPEGVFDVYAAASISLLHCKPTANNESKQPVLTYTEMDFMVS